MIIIESNWLKNIYSNHILGSHLQLLPARGLQATAKSIRSQ